MRSEKKTGTLKGTAEDIVELSQSAQTARTRMRLRRRRRMAVVRAFVPLVAGIVRMSSGQFYLANILSALVWAPLHALSRRRGR